MPLRRFSSQGTFEGCSCHIPALECLGSGLKDVERIRHRLFRRQNDADSSGARSRISSKARSMCVTAFAHNFRFPSPIMRAKEKSLGNPKIFPDSTIFII
jgi:hypothetical protein